jgi:hypothetical protein
MRKVGFSSVPKCGSDMGGGFFLVEVPGELVQDLQEIGRSLRGLSVGDLKRRIDEQAQRKVGM